ncbi:MAG: hypothetical protein AAF823_11725 [Planctomycetota bacterium]
MNTLCIARALRRSRSAFASLALAFALPLTVAPAASALTISPGPIYELDSGLVRLSELPNEVLVDRAADEPIVLQGTLSSNFIRRTTLIVDSEQRWARSGVVFRNLDVRFTTNEPLVHEVHNADTSVTLENVDLRGWSAIDDASTQALEGRFHVRDPVRASSVEIVNTKWSQMHRGPVGAQRVERTLIQDINADALTHATQIRDVTVDGMSSRGTGSHDDVYQFYGGKRSVYIDGLTVTNSDGALFRTSAADRGDLHDISIKNVYAPTLKSEWNVQTQGLTVDNIQTGAWTFDLPRDGNDIQHTDVDITNASVAKLTLEPGVSGITPNAFDVDPDLGGSDPPHPAQPTPFDWSIADLDGNGKLNDADLEIFSSRYNQDGTGDLSIDFTQDGRVDRADIDAFTDAFGVYLTTADEAALELNLEPVVLPEPALAPLALATAIAIRSRRTARIIARR